MRIDPAADRPGPTAIAATREPLRSVLQALRPGPPRLSIPVAYAVAIAAVALGVLVQDLFISRPAIAPFLLFFPCVAVVSWVAGRLPGLLAVALSAVAGNYFFIPPYRVWSLATAPLVVTVLFALSSAVVARASASLRGAFLESERVGAKQKQAQRALRENEQRMKRTQQIAHLGSWELDLTTDRLSWSDEVYRIFGLEPQEFGATYEAFLEAVHPDDRAAVDAAYSGSLREGKDRYEIEHRVVRRSNGEIRVVHEKCEHIRDASGRIVQSIGMVHDITETKWAEEVSARNAAELEAVFTAMSDGILIHDGTGKVVRSNTAACTLHGSGPIGLDLESLGKHLALRWLDGRSVLRDEIPAMRALRGERVVGQRFIMKAANGQDVIVEASSAPLQIGGERVGAVTVCHDISDLMEAQKALSEADRHKNEFLAILSHELRNPLAPIRNSLYILECAEPEGEQARRAQMVIDRQVAHMTRLIDDLLDVTRVSRGKIELHKGPLELGELVRRTVEDHRSEFTNGGIDLVVALPERALWVDGDATRLAQVIGNLLQNAAKFTPRGGRTWIALEEHEAGGGATIEVGDTGLGISAEMLPRVFEAFTQSAHTLDRTHGGLGLGLALVKGLVDLHGGAVKAQSEGVGKGARFSVWLPLQTVPHLAERAPVPVAGVVRRRVLVIEDNVDAAESLREALELNHHLVAVAFDGIEGLEKARRLKPDVVLCDIGLPGMDGYEVAKAFRADPGLDSVVLVALTGYALPEDVARAQQAGFDDHLAKPPTLEKIEQALAARAPSRRRREGRAAGAR